MPVTGLPPLPVLDVADRLRAAIVAGHVVLTAAPGSGKTTLVPLLLRDADWLGGRRIVMLEPRRPAARMAARRMAQLLGEPVGQTVGYQVRFERRVSAATRIEVLTEGLLLRRLQQDPELAGVGLLIFDEFHERNLNSDLSLALALDSADALRDDLRLLVMSASMDAAPLAALLSATRIDAPGRAYPVTQHGADNDLDPGDPVPACERMVDQALAACAGDVLVFLPGRREIDRLVQRLQVRLAGEIEVLPLYGELSAAEQDRVLGGRGPRRRVIAATDIAETSLTIDGVEAVVDSGLARRPVFEPGAGLTRLETRWISKASALQRAGRAGRQGPGMAWRGWTDARHARLDDWQVPELLRSDLAPTVLELAAWGVDSPSALRWLDEPPQPAWTQARALLERLDALDAQGRITATGRRMVALPLHPRLAHLLVAVHRDDQALAVDVAALLSERDPLRGGGAGKGETIGADIDLRLAALHAWRAGSGAPPAAVKRALQRVDQVARQLARLCPTDGGLLPRGLDANRCVALAYPDRLARRTGRDGGRYQLRGGRAVRLRPDDPLQGREWLVVADLDARARDGSVWLAAALDDADVAALFGDAITLARELRWDPGSGDVVARACRRLDALLLDERPVPLQADDPVPEMLCEQVRVQGLGLVPGDADDLRARVELARRDDPSGGWPDLRDAALRTDVEGWLMPWLRRGEGAGQLRRLRLDNVLAGLLDWSQRQRLDALLPTHVDTPAGTRRRISYTVDGPPSLAVPLQEVLGLSAGPAVLDGRLPLVLQLLSPAGRPLQVTSDLAAFWRGAYSEVKKEMRGRYPKHHWPDDPANAQATRFTRRRPG